TSMDELIVCEDGSIDRSMAKWAKRLTRPNDFLIRSNDLHEIRTYARAIGYSRAELVCLMQDDDHPPKDGAWLDEAVALFERYPALAVVGGWCGFNGYFREVYNSPARWQRRRVEIPSRDPAGELPMVFVESVNIGPYLLRRNVYEELGGFDVSFAEPGTPGICFESEYCLRAWTHGYQVALVEIPVKDRYPGQGGTLLWAREERRRNEARNKQRIVEMYDAHLADIQQRVREANAGLIAR
ncbi:MAG TPA: hypothetical protein VJ653_08680, partial [Acidimicrobiales bacterium]|nr:hypothetical protein [Acidimicrobiales bacterium]